MAAKLKDQDLEISGLKSKVKFLEDKDRGSAEPTQEDAPIKGGIMEIGEEVGAKKSTELGSNDTEEMCGNIIHKMTKRDYNWRKELKMMIEGLDRSNEVIAKHLQEYEQAEAELTVREKIELINELEQKEFYMLVLRSHAGWKTKHFKEMTLEEIKEKFIPVWKQFEDFGPMSSKDEAEIVKRKELKSDQGSAKRMTTSEDVSKEDLKGMMQLVPLEEVYVEALQVKHPIIDWEIHSEGKREYQKIIRPGGHIAVYQFFVDMLIQFDKEDLHQLWMLAKETFSIRQATKDKEKELWVELKRLFELDFENQLWTHNQAFMHDPLDWKLYDWR
nr:hypothetical protein [Tanacetum cinerariifolium]